MRSEEEMAKEVVLIFKSQLTSLVQNIFQKITSESAGI